MGVCVRVFGCACGWVCGCGGGGCGGVWGGCERERGCVVVFYPGNTILTILRVDRSQIQQSCFYSSIQPLCVNRCVLQALPMHDMWK